VANFKCLEVHILGRRKTKEQKKIKNPLFEIISKVTIGRDQK
jgi:hypothetical protein